MEISSRDMAACLLWIWCFSAQLAAGAMAQRVSQLPPAVSAANPSESMYSTDTFAVIPCEVDVFATSTSPQSGTLRHSLARSGRSPASGRCMRTVRAFPLSWVDGRVLVSTVHSGYSAFFCHEPAELADGIERRFWVFESELVPVTGYQIKLDDVADGAVYAVSGISDSSVLPAGISRYARYFRRRLPSVVAGHSWRADGLLRPDQVPLVLAWSIEHDYDGASMFYGVIDEFDRPVVVSRCIEFSGLPWHGRPATQDLLVALTDDIQTFDSSDGECILRHGTTLWHIADPDNRWISQFDTAFQCRVELDAPEKHCYATIAFNSVDMHICSDDVLLVVRR